MAALHPDPGADTGSDTTLTRVQLVQAALGGTGTVVWEWQIDSDALSELWAGVPVLGWQPGEAGHTQADWNRLIHPEDLAANEAAYQRHARGEVDTYEHAYRARAKDGSWRWVQERGRIVERHADGRPRRMVGTQTDIHAQVTAQLERDQARQAAAVAAAANRAKTEFLSRMSHELRTPLNAVLGFAQLMEIDAADPPSDGQRRRLALIRESGAHLLRMIGDLLDLTQIEAGGMHLQPETVALPALARQALDMVSASAEAAGVSLLPLQLHAGSGALQAQADPTRLRQVLLNLLSNAIKYNRRGGQVALGLDLDGQGWPRLQVSDTGVGIPPADLPRIFEPFQRGHQAGGGIEGTGIGLSVTHALVAAMGGHIEARSRLGAGSVFSVSLPPAGAQRPGGGAASAPLSST